MVKVESEPMRREKKALRPAVDNRMGKWGATSYILGTIIGSGIFITPTTIYANVHSVGLSLLIWLLTAVLSLIGAYCYIELGTGIQRSGAEFTYLCHVNWHALAFASMLCSVFIINPGSMAVKMDALGQYLFQALQLDLCDERLDYWAPKMIGICVAMLLLCMNCFSLGSVAAPFQMTISCAKVGTGVLIILIGVWALVVGGQTQYVAHPFAGAAMDANGWMVALFAGIYSYGGWDALNYGTEDVKDRRKAFPFAVLSGMAVVTALYLGMNFAYFVVLSPAEFEQSKAVAISFAHKTMGPLAFVMPLLIMLVLVGSINASYFGASRFLWAAARERHVPAFINCLNLRHDSPRAALYIQFFLSVLLSFAGNLDQLISYVSYAHLMTRIFTIAALLRIRLLKDQQSCQRAIHEEVLESPVLVPILFLALCLCIALFTIYSSFWIAFSSLACLAIGLVLYTIFHSRFGLPRSGHYQRWAYRVNDSLCRFAQIVFDGKVELERE